MKIEKPVQALRFHMFGGTFDHHRVRCSIHVVGRLLWYFLIAAHCTHRLIQNAQCAIKCIEKISKRNIGFDTMQKSMLLIE